MKRLYRIWIFIILFLSLLGICGCPGFLVNAIVATYLNFSSDIEGPGFNLPGAFPKNKDLQKKEAIQTIP